MSNHSFIYKCIHYFTVIIRNPLNSKFHYRLCELYQAIDEYVAEKIKPSLDDSMSQPDVYKYCLVNADDGYCRAKVLEVEYESEISMEVFLLDTGLSKKVEIEKVYDIPDDLIQRFPFQVNKSISIFNDNNSLVNIFDENVFRQFGVI